MDRETKMRVRKMLESIVPEDLDYDDRRAFVLFGAKNPNQTWEDLVARAPSPEFAARLQPRIEEKEIKMATIIAMDEWEE